MHSLEKATHMAAKIKQTTTKKPHRPIDGHALPESVTVQSESKWCRFGNDIFHNHSIVLILLCTA